MASTSKYRPEPLPQPRPHMQAALAALITAAEANRDSWARAVAGMNAAGRPCRREEAMLRLATEKLGLLRQSQTTLAVGVPAEQPRRKKGAAKAAPGECKK